MDSDRHPSNASLNAHIISPQWEILRSCPGQEYHTCTINWDQSCKC